MRDSKGRFVKGHIHSKITLEKISKSRKGKNIGNTKGFKKGQKTWNKGNRKYNFNCGSCGKRFKTSDKRRKYCSMKCSPKRSSEIIIIKCRECKKDISVPRYLLNRKKYCSKGCYYKNRTGNTMEKCKNWKGGRIIDHDGYVLIKNNHNKPRYTREHRLIMEKFIKRKLKKHEIVHHINENKLDNRIENLKIMTRKEHINHHKPHVKL